jgi:urea-proton symporter
MQAVPVDGNKGGSLITMYSSKGLQFGWIFFASCFGWVWADQGFWQSAIAARPSAAYKCGTSAG